MREMSTVFVNICADEDWLGQITAIFKRTDTESLYTCLAAGVAVFVNHNYTVVK